MIKLNETLWESLRHRAERLPHAVLIQGPEGVGKLALAERLAGRLLCESPTELSDACGRCEGCRWVGAGTHPDLRRLEPDALAENVGSSEESERETRGGRRAKPSIEIRVDQIRELSNFLYLGSHRGRRRVAIVHPAEAMNDNAANALLKGLEEPPAGAMFLLVSHHPARLLPTIRSRCVVVSVARPEESAALAWLEAITPPVRDAKRWLAFSGGSPRLAREYADGERGARVGPYLEALAKGAVDRMPEATDRESLESLAEALQKHAVDQFTRALAGRSVYGTVASSGDRRSAPSLAWIGFARYMGWARALTRHPVNPRLFSSEMISKVSKLIKSM
ncbi:MAG: DNA polymerase III subunit delta' [bacterium]|jgi:DNA polymerase-3 subunit delta'